MKTCHFWYTSWIIFMLMWICILLMTIKTKPKQLQQVDIFENNLNEKLIDVLLEIDNLQKENDKLTHQVIVLTQRLRVFEKNNSKEKHLNGPSEEYELLRRRIYSNTKEFWYYISSELRSLAMTVKGIEPFTIKIETTIYQLYVFLLEDIAQLSNADGYGRWRWDEYVYLIALVDKRLRFLQNPQDCSKAKKLACNLISDRQSCEYGCRLHHLINCLLVAYATERTLVLDNPENWGFSDGISSMFFPLSNECTLSSDSNETVLPWPGNESVQVVNLSLPIAVPAGSNHVRRPTGPPFNPLVLPEDLVHKINVIHGDPAVWWIGQFTKYIFRPKLSTFDLFDDYKELIEFSGSIVGVCIRQTDKIDSFHKLEEYMYQVEEYYKLKESNGKELSRLIYLSTDEPALFEEINIKYPEYRVFGDPELSEAGSVATHDLDESIKSINVDLYFLARCEYLVGTFSSSVFRLAYVIVNGATHTDAFNRFTSLDGEYYFSDQIRRLNVAVLPHKANRPQDMDLQVGDEIEVIGNKWNGYSLGTNLRTNKTLLYPTFKVIRKNEVMSFASYPSVQLSMEDIE